MPRPGSEPVELDGKVIRLGENAALMRVGNHDYWIPYSVLHDDNDWKHEEADVGDEVTFIVKEWFAEKEGLV